SALRLHPLSSLLPYTTLFRSEPNNWRSCFSGSAWEYDEATGEYYLHLFSKKQPDLNWENPRVRAAIYDMMHWWLQKGVDGFRMDVINMLSKVPGLPDAPPVTGERYEFGGQYFIHGPRLEEFLQEMKREVLSAYDLITVGETPNVLTAQAATLTHEETGSLNMVFQFEHMDLDVEPGGPSETFYSPALLAALMGVMTLWQTDRARI